MTWLSGFNFETQHFTRLAFGDDLEWPAADFAVGGETLKRHTRVNHQVEALAAKRALDGFRDFHDPR